jgi:hypothetical protein
MASLREELPHPQNHKPHMKLRSTASTLAPSRPDFLNSLSQEETLKQFPAGNAQILSRGSERMLTSAPATAPPRGRCGRAHTASGSPAPGRARRFRAVQCRDHFLGCNVASAARTAWRSGIGAVDRGVIAPWSWTARQTLKLDARASRRCASASGWISRRGAE